jgi:peptide/nickel transport system substrate-binding protein
MTWKTRILAAALAVGAMPALAQTTLRIVPHSDLSTLDPIQTTARITVNHGNMIFDTLYAWDEELNVRPQMVGESKRSSDGLSLTMTLRPGLKFHDGSPVRSADVVASVKRWMVRDVAGRKLAEFTAEIKAVDDNTIAIALKQPAGWVEFALGASAGTIPIIMREKEAATDPAKGVTEMVGSGPFKFVASEWKPGSRVVYVKNSDYVPRSEAPSGLSGGKVVKVDRAEWHVIPDPATAVNALVQGEVDLLDTTPNDFIPQLSRNKDIVIRPIDKGGYGALRPNFLHPPFNNEKARQAVAMLFDQKDFLRASVGNDEKWWRTCHAYFFCGTPFGTEAGSEPYRTPNKERAKQLLAEAGYKGEKIVILSPTSSQSISSLAEVAAGQLRSIGVNVDLQGMEWNAMLARRSKKDPPEQGGWHIAPTTISNGLVFHPLINFASDTACGGRNWPGWPCDEEAEKLKVQFLAAVDPVEQKRLAEALHKRLWEFVPYWLTGQFQAPYAWRANVQGVVNASVIVFWNITKG